MIFRRRLEHESPNLDLGLLRRIVVDASAAHTADDFVNRVVSQVRDAMHVDVCSLYRLDESGRLRMAANIGLNPGVASDITLAPDEGLVGTIASTRLPLNLQSAQTHPAYRYFPGSGEESFQAFLGAPIINLGKAVGVLVVQDRMARPFPPDAESVLVTIAAQLAGVMPRSGPVAPAPTSLPLERRIEGFAAAPGKALGRIHLVLGEQTLNLMESPAPRSVRTELRLLKQAIRSAQRQLLRARSRLAGGEFRHGTGADVLSVFDVYNEMLNDDMLLTSAEQKIRKGESAFAAVRSSIDQHAAAFEALDDEYLRARAADVRHVGHTLLRAILGTTIKKAAVTSRVILLGSEVSITDFSPFESSEVTAVVSMKGSRLSHTVVLARALGIPAVVATGPIDHIHEGDRAVVDGDSGLLLLNPGAGTMASYEAALASARKVDAELAGLKELPAVTLDGQRIGLLVNTGLLADISPGKSRGAEGVGLYRSEIPFLGQAAFPTEREQTATYRAVLAAYAPQPVTMRTLDVGGDKMLPYLRVDEANPALGWRGIRFSMDNPTVLRTQLRAMLEASRDYQNLRIMLPMVSSAAEVRSSAELLTKLSDELAIPRPSLGIMVEIPAVIPLLEHLRPWIDFVSVGSNDLVQYLLAVDRDNPRVADLYDHMHPAVIGALANVARIARELELELSICGEMATDPDAVPLLVGLGFDALSVNAHHLPRIKALVRALRAADCRSCVAEALTRPDAQAVRATLHALVASAVPTAETGGSTEPPVRARLS